MLVGTVICVCVGVMYSGEYTMFVTVVRQTFQLAWCGCTLTNIMLVVVDVVFDHTAEH
jgi:hypothetical protein